MFESFLTNPWPIVSAILLACFVGYIAWRNNFKTRRATACDVFRAAVLGQLAGLYPSVNRWPENIDHHLRSVFPALQTAVARFRPFVPWHQRIFFDRAWLRYRSAYLRKIDVQCYHHYQGFVGDPDPRETFHSNVSRLLAYAKET